jgi:DNA-binding response OmpR family regulator
MTSHVLIVEDDTTIRVSLEQALLAEGLDVSLAANGASALSAAMTTPPDLVLLDLGLPDIDGVTLCRELRLLFPNLAIIMLTARRDEVDVVIGLDAGANDYVTKPFRLAELLARVRAHLRRPSVHEPSETVSIGGLRIEAPSRRVWMDDVEVQLRPREFDLLLFLALACGSVVTRERIMDEVWDMHWQGSTKTLDVHVSALRRKLAVGDEARRPQITALPRVGYRLDEP